jgi:AraC-like DNA-binding protein
MTPIWLEAVVRHIQHVTGSGVVRTLQQAYGDLINLARVLPDANTPTERLFLKALLFQVAWRSCIALHAQAHAGRTYFRCAFSELDTLREFFAELSPDPREAFRRWVYAFFFGLEKTHPESIAFRASRLIQEGSAQPLNVSHLAHRFHVTASQLRRSFFGEFGVTLRDYHNDVRVLASLELLPGQKSEAVALNVGFRSKKNFYEQLRKRTGLTPTRFRQLSDVRRVELVESLRAKLIGRRGLDARVSGAYIDRRQRQEL